MSFFSKLKYLYLKYFNANWIYNVDQTGVSKIQRNHKVILDT